MESFLLEHILMQKESNGPKSAYESQLVECDNNINIAR